MRRRLIPFLAAALLLALHPGFARADEPSRVKGTGGWQDYTDLRIALAHTPDGPHSDMVFETTDGEMLATVSTPGADTVLQFVIPSVVYMSRGLPEEYARKADTLDAIGLQSQLFLMFLEQAFPEGPASIQGTDRRTIREEKATHELRFLGAAVTFPAGWSVDVKAERMSPTRLVLEIAYKSLKDSRDDSFARATWDGAPHGPVLPDTEPLANWAVNFFGKHSVSPAGQHEFKATIGDISAFTTLGQVRAAARRMSAP
jgi:hypothetical protein